MVRRLIFDESKRLYFRMILPSFTSRGSAPPDSRVTETDLRSDSRILTALKDISDPVGDIIPVGDLDNRTRVLKQGENVLELSQADFIRLSDYIKSTQWASGVADVAVDLIDWFDTAEKV